MRKVGIALGFLLLLLPARESYSQFTGYVSATYGHHQNPLYNYEELSDQLRQTYTELHHTTVWNSSFMKFSYVSGLMIFNRFTARNYYEHNLSGKYSIAFPTTPTPSDPSPVMPGDEEEDAGEVEESQVPDDSSGSFLDVGLKIGARHDKTAYKEFDNIGSSASASYRFDISDDVFLRVSNTLDYRRYVYLSELSNLTDAVSLQMGTASGHSLAWGIRTGVGLKHYTSSLFDTARFEATRTFFYKPAGKGKPGARIRVPSSKLLLINSDSDNILQLSMGTYLTTSWSDGSAGVELLYRRNPGSPSRYLAQYVNTSILNEDIYNDHFSFEGPEVRVRFTQMLPLSLQSILTIEHQRKRFGAPAVSLLGEQCADNRIDLRHRVELYLSKYIELTDAIGMDVALGTEALRNQSNDAYNDFFVFQISASIGIGF